MILRPLMLGITITMVGLATGANAAESPDKPTMEDKAKEAAEAAADTLSDSWITLKTKLALYADERVSGTAINVDTRQGVVTLRGNVPSSAAKEAAEADAKQIDGVKLVENALEVSPPATQKSMAERKDE